jgi:hypothetical protein
VSETDSALCSPFRVASSRLDGTQNIRPAAGGRGALGAGVMGRQLLDARQSPRLLREPSIGSTGVRPAATFRGVVLARFNVGLRVLTGAATKGVGLQQLPERGAVTRRLGRRHGDLEVDDQGAVHTPSVQCDGDVTGRGTGDCRQNGNTLVSGDYLAVAGEAARHVKGTSGVSNGHEGRGERYRIRPKA